MKKAIQWETLLYFELLLEYVVWLFQERYIEFSMSYGNFLNILQKGHLKGQYFL